MEETLDNRTPTNKIYKEKAIGVGTFLGGPLVAGYLIAENFKAFNETDKAKKTWIYTIVATVIIFSGIFLIPDNVKIPNQIIPLIYTAIASYLTQYLQGQNILAHLNSGGQFFGWGRTIAVGLIGLVITIVSIFGFVFISESMNNASISTKTFGKMKHEIAFDKNNISEIEVDKIADGLTKTAFFDDAITKYVYADKVNSNFELTISVVEGIANDSQALQPFIALRTDLQTLFPQNKIVLKLVVDNLDNVVKTIE
ncbi:MAG: hypothetical protein ACK5RG_17300 [Cyclobacteriaceae bacterium]|jgi:hypothetical protein